MKKEPTLEEQMKNLREVLKSGRGLEIIKKNQGLINSHLEYVNKKEREFYDKVNREIWPYLF